MRDDRRWSASISSDTKCGEFENRWSSEQTESVSDSDTEDERERCGESEKRCGSK